MERIFKLLEEHNLNELQAIKKIGLSIGTFANWRNGKAKPSVEALTKIADYFDVTVDYLIGREAKVFVSKQSHTSDPLRAELDETWDKLDTLKKAKVLGFAQALTEVEDERKRRIIDL